MSTALTAYVDGDIIDAAALRASSRGVEAWLNEAVAAGDLDTSAWCQSSHLFPPFVYGDPAPRFDAQAVTASYRSNLFTQRDRTLLSHETSATSVQHRIPRLAARHRVVEASVPTVIKASWFSYIQGGTLDVLGTEATAVANFNLYVDGSIVGGTVRRLYLSNALGYYSKKQHGIYYDTTLGVGTHNIEIRMDSLVAGSSRFIFIEPRNFTVVSEYR